MTNNKYPIWQTKNGEIISCVEKIKVMRENLEEIEQVIRDAYEDALLMDVDSSQIKNYFLSIINNLKTPFKDN